MNRKKQTNPKTPKNKSKRNKPTDRKTRKKKSVVKDRPSREPVTGSQRQYDSPVESREEILAHLADKAAPQSYKALLAAFGYSQESDEAEGLRRRLGAMCRDGQIIRNRAGAYLPVNDSDLVAGFVSANAQGFGFVVCDDGKPDVFLNAAQMRQVFHGDKVVICITGIDHRGRREGRITDVLERAHQEMVGRLVIEPGVTFVVPDNNKIHMDVLVDADSVGEARHGDVVVIDIVEQPSRKHPPVGKIVRVLGEHLEAGMEIEVALHSHGIPFEWPDAVDKQTAKFKSKPGKKDMQGRRDITALPLVTIDGEDARDFDDAVYCEPTESGYRLYVAIADVSHYVVPGTPLDTEAQRRGTSVYFPEHVVPMLPEALSNGLCSINPDVERLCMLCVMSLNEKGELKRTRFERAVMKSHARLTYTQVGAIITDRDKALRKQYKELVPHLENLHKLYLQLKRQRSKRGCIEFDSQESRFVFDESRKIKQILPVERNVAHMMIEESMILANVAAAAYLLRHRMPALYRVHHGPTADRLDDLRSFLALRDLSLDGGDAPDANDFARLAKQAAKLPDAGIIQMVMLRSMQAALYQPRNEGHFGLALDHYAHFTSPIRRYPDLLVHRAIGHIIDRGKVSDYQYSDSEMAALGETCSMTERRAEEATRDVVGWLKCEYMVHHIGDEFNGVVSSVTSFGLFVQLEGLFIDGLIHISTLGQDYFHFDASSLTLKGERTGMRFGLGDAVRVRVSGANLEDRKIDFELLDSANIGGKRRRKGAKSSRPGDAKKGAHENKRKKGKNEKRTVEKKGKKDKKSRKKKKSPKNRKSTAKNVATKKQTAKKSTGKKTSSKTTRKSAGKKGAAGKGASARSLAKKRVSKKTGGKKQAKSGVRRKKPATNRKRD